MIESRPQAAVVAIHTQESLRRSRRRTSARAPSAASSVDSTSNPAIHARLTCACRSGARAYDSAPTRKTVPSSIWMIACFVPRARSCAARTCRSDRPPAGDTGSDWFEAMANSLIRQPVAGLQQVGVAEGGVLKVVAVRDLEGA